MRPQQLQRPVGSIATNQAIPEEDSELWSAVAKAKSPVLASFEAIRKPLKATPGNQHSSRQPEAGTSKGVDDDDAGRSAGIPRRLCRASRAQLCQPWDGASWNWFAGDEQAGGSASSSDDNSARLVHKIALRSRLHPHRIR